MNNDNNRGADLTEYNKKWLIFLVVAVGVFMATLDSSMVNIALPTIMAEFQSPLNQTEWVVLIYLLTITATLLFWGHLSDRVGRRRVYACGLFTFALGSLVCAFAPSLSVLIAFRFIQALGAAMTMATGPAIVKESFPPQQLGRALGFIGVAVSLGLMTGPSIGDLLIEIYSWRSIFFITVPVGFLFTLLACRLLPVAANTFQFTKIDWRGAAAWAVFLTTFSLAITHISSHSWSQTNFMLFITTAVLALIFFLFQENATLYPILPLKLFRKRYFTAAVICAVLSFMVLFTAIMLTPFYLDRVREFSTIRIGLFMMAIPIAVLFVAPLAGWLSDHIGRRIPATLGLIITSIGAMLMSRLNSQTAPWQIIVYLALLGCGQAMFLSPNSAAVLSRAHDDHNGISAAMLATARNFGMLLGIAQASLIFSLTFSKLTGGLDMKDFSPLFAEDFTTALSHAFIAAAAIGLIGALVSWLRDPVRSA